MAHPLRFSAVILAGGQSRRMGRDKAWIEWGGQTLLARQVARARSLGPAEVFVSGRGDTDYSALGCRVLTDPVAGVGPLAGVLAALRASSASHVLVLAVDLPLMSEAVLHGLLANCTDDAGAVPQAGRRVEPLAAVYPVGAASIAERMLRHRLQSMRVFAENCRRGHLVRIQPVEERHWACFANWNTPGDVAVPDRGATGRVRKSRESAVASPAGRAGR